MNQCAGEWRAEDQSATTRALKTAEALGVERVNAFQVSLLLKKKRREESLGPFLPRTNLRTL